MLLGSVVGQAPTASAQPLLQWYQQGGLKALEWDNYLAWLAFNDRPGVAAKLRGQVDRGEQQAYAAALLTPSYREETEQQGHRYWKEADLERWRTLRDQAPARLAASALYRWGLTPQQPRPARFFTAPLLPLPFWVTVAALLLLAPLAVPLEKAIGHGRTLALWVLGSLAAGGGYLLLAQPGDYPFYGALPAMQVWAGAFFGQQRLQAVTVPVITRKDKTLRWRAVSPLWLLPLPLAAIGLIAALVQPWLALLSAAIGALVTGAVLVQLMQARLEAPDTQQSDTTQDPEISDALTQGWEALASLDGSLARKHFGRVLSQQPHHFNALTGQFTALQITGEHKRWLAIARQLFSHPATDTGEPTQIAHYWQQYRHRRGPALPSHLGWPLAATLARAHHFKAAEALATSLPADEHSVPALTTIKAELAREGLEHRLENWRPAARA